MFVRCKKRFKDGKEHRYWSVVENVRVSGGRVAQRQVLYLGEINDSQRAAWCRSIEVVEGTQRSKQVALFPEDREAPELDCEVVQVRLKELTLHAPRQWGACWLALTLWDRLELDRFRGPRLPASREGTRWLDILKIKVCYRLIDPGSDWRLHRHWYEQSALRDLLGCDRVIASNTLYRCLDKLAAHKQDFFSFLRARWTTMLTRSSGLARTVRGWATAGLAGVAIGVLLPAGVLTISTTSFAFSDNFEVVTRAAAITIVVGLAQMVVLAAGGLNLAVGATGGLVAAVIGSLMNSYEVAPALAVLGGLAVGTASGALIGFVIVQGRYSPFIATLAALSVFTGIALGMTRSVPFYHLPDDFQAFGSGSILGVPLIFCVALVLALVLGVVFRYASFGRQILAFGANARAAELNGVSGQAPPDRGVCAVGVPQTPDMTAQPLATEERAARSGSKPRLELEGITKIYPGVTALDDVSLSLERGDVHALLGENGAGKSTLNKIIAGVEHADSGTYRLDGRPAEVRNPRQAMQKGISVVHQERNLVPTFTVGENVLLERVLGRADRLVDRRAVHADALPFMEMVGLDVPPGSSVGHLSAAQQQLVEIARALTAKASILLLDEPTASISLQEASALLETIRSLRDPRRLDRPCLAQAGGSVRGL